MLRFLRSETPGFRFRSVAATGLSAFLMLSLALACSGSSSSVEPSSALPATSPSDDAALATTAAVSPTDAPTPTPMPDPVELVEETAANLLDLESMRFEMTHESGGIYIAIAAVKATRLVGAWDHELGAEVSVDAYLVNSPDDPPEQGTHVEIQFIVSPDGYFVTDPVSGAWAKRPVEHLAMPIDRANHAFVDMLTLTENPQLTGQETVDGVESYRIEGRAPASVMEWMLFTAEEGQYVDVVFWSDVERKLLRKIRISGAIGNFDAPGTVREMVLSDINGPVDITPPGEFVDLSQF